MPWKERAREMYFESGMRVGDIAVYLDVSRQEAIRIKMALRYIRRKS